MADRKPKRTLTDEDRDIVWTLVTKRVDYESIMSLTNVSIHTVGVIARCARAARDNDLPTLERYRSISAVTVSWAMSKFNREWNNPVKEIAPAESAEVVHTTSSTDELILRRFFELCDDIQKIRMELQMLHEELK